MKKSNKISLKFCLSLLLSVGAMVGMLGLFCTTPAMGQTTQCVLAEISSMADSKIVKSGNWTYELDEQNHTATLVSYNVIENLNPEWIHHDIDSAMRESFGYGLRIEIPATIDDVPVVALGFKDGRQSIFSECGNVTEITFAEGSKVECINKNAFKELAGLVSVTIPATVKFIGESAFESAIRLQSISVEDNEVYTTVDGVLYTKDLSTLLCYPAANTNSSFVVPDGVKTIYGGAFSGTLNLESVTIPNSVTKIGNYAFKHSNIESIVLPNSVTEVGKGCFSDCAKLSSIVLPENEQFTTISDDMFLQCKKLSQITIPNSVKTIGSDAFFMCRTLQSVVIPSSVQTIDVRAFNYCVSLSKIVFEHTTCPDNFIKAGAFITGAIRPVVKLSSLEVLKNMQSNYAKCFTNAPACFELKTTKVIIGNLTLYTKYGDTENYYLDNLCTQVFSGKVKVPSSNAFTFNGYFTSPYGGGERVVDDNGNLLTAVGSESLSEIELYPYSYNGKPKDWNYKIIDGKAHVISYIGYNRQNFYIPAYIKDGDKEYKVVEVGLNSNKKNNVFLEENDGKLIRDNAHITSVEIPGTVEKISDYAFFKCKKLIEVQIGEGVKSIGNYAFYGCKSVLTLRIPGSVKTIGLLSFRGSTSLERLTLGEGITKIRDYAFFGCSKLKTVVLPSTIKKVGANSFGACPKLSLVTTYSELRDFTEHDKYLAVLQYERHEYVISKNVTQIDPTKFNDLKGISYFTVEEGNTEYMADNGILYSLDGKRLIRCPVGYIGEVEILDSVEVIEDYAFNACSGITEICFEGVKSIGKWAFASCTGLTSLEFGVSLKTVGEYAFKNCSSLESVRFSAENNDGAQKICKYAFEYCSNLSSVSLPDTLNYIGAYAFANCPKLQNIVLPDSITEIKSGAFRNSGLMSVELPKNEKFTEVSFNTFGFCKSLTKVYIPANVVNIGEYAFAWTTKLYNVTLGSKDTKYTKTSFITSIKGKEVKIIYEGE